MYCARIETSRAIGNLVLNVAVLFGLLNNTLFVGLGNDGLFAGFSANKPLFFVSAKKGW